MARFSPSPHVTYAMFAGGGMAWAEDEMKAGRHEVSAAAPGSRPDLSGLSCRWNPVAARHGEILSLLVAPEPDATAENFETLVRAVHDIIAKSGDRESSPLGEDRLPNSWPPKGLDLEARATSGVRPRWTRYLPILFEALIPMTLDRLGMRLKRFDPVHYRRVLIDNSDFRKFDDGLKMTVDCSAETAAAIEALLEDARRSGIAVYGLHRQESALMTCIVPSPFSDDHLHFIDGAAGGYAMAAVMLKAMKPDRKKRKG